MPRYHKIYLPILAFASIVSLSACGPEVNTSRPAEGIDVKNNPNGLLFFQEVLNDHLDSLPTSGRVEKYWFNGNYYPFSANGIAARQGSQSLSPLEKYDLAFAQGTAATDWEKIHHGNEGPNSPEPWEGHCNGVAASIAVAPEPIRAVDYNGVNFSPSDLKALLAESLYRAETVLVGDRCRIQNLTYDPDGRPIKGECRDINAGSFHVILANMLGIKRKIVVADVKSGYEVWNYPLVSFEVLEQQEITANQAQALVSGLSSPYRFNAHAVRYFSVRTRFTHLTSAEVVETLSYVLELDRNGKIIGGEWVGNSKDRHPDFLWQPGDPHSDNPHVDFFRLKKIVVKSL